VENVERFSAQEAMEGKDPMDTIIGETPDKEIMLKDWEESSVGERSIKGSPN